MNTLPSTIIVPPTAGQALRAFGDEITPVLTGAQTNGQYSMFRTVTPPGGGPPPHRHMNEDEWFLVVEGRAEFFRDGVWTEVPVGTVVYTPRGVVHSFRNAGTTPLRMVLHTAPSGFENFFARAAAECAKPGSPDMPRLIQIAAEHGIYFA